MIRILGREILPPVWTVSDVRFRDAMSMRIIGRPSGLVVGEPRPRPRGFFKTFGRHFRRFVTEPTGLVHAALQFGLGFGIGRGLAGVLPTWKARAAFYVGSQALLGGEPSYILGGMHMGVMTGGLEAWGFKEQLTRALEREIPKRAARRVSDRPRWQMPEQPGVPGTGFITPLLGLGLWVGSTVAGAAVGWALGGDTGSPPPGVPEPVTSIKSSASAFVAPFAAWAHTGSGLWGLFGAGLLMGRILDDL